MKYVTKIGSILLFAFLFACAPAVRMQVLKPAELQLQKPVKRIAVLDFNFKGMWDFGETELTSTQVKVLGFKFKVRESVKKARTASVPEYSGDKVAAQLISKLVNNGYYQVVERSKLQQILEEQKLSLTGVVDEETAVEVGRLLGVEALLVGYGDYTVKDHGNWSTFTRTERTKDKKKVKVPYRRYTVQRDVVVTLNFRLVSTETGEILASNTITSRVSKSVKRENKESYFKTGERRKKQDIELAARQALPHWKTMVDQGVNSGCQKIVLQIAPHYVVVKRTLEKGKSKEMKMAIEYTKRGLWEDAAKIWEKYVNRPGSKDYVPAMYNLAIYYEAIDQLEEAEELFEKCYRATGKNKYLDGKARVVRRKKELEKLKQQGALEETTNRTEEN